MATVRVVTGLCPIPERRRDYEGLALRLIATCEAAGVPVTFCRQAVEDCWLWPLVQGGDVRWATGDNPAKNTLAFHAIQHEKTAWLARTAAEHLEDVLVWIDCGIIHIDRIDPAVIAPFLELCREETGLAIPGCWAPQGWWDDERINWRFCGTVAICHRRMVRRFHEAVRRTTVQRLEEDRLVTWETNDWAKAEQDGLPVRWHEANWDSSMFTGYEPPEKETVAATVLPDFGHGDGWRRERELLVRMAREVDGDVLEIGTNRGETAAYLAAALPERTIWTLDGVDQRELSPAQRAERLPDHEVGAACRGAANVRQLWGDSKFLSYPEGVDFIFIDGDHSEMGVAVDTWRALEYAKRRKSCIIAWHDYLSGAPWVKVKQVLDRYQLPVTHYPGTMVAALAFGEVKLP